MKPMRHATCGTAAAESSCARVRRVTAIESWNVVHRLCGTWDAAVTSRTHGTYLLRRARTASRCPFLRYEIVRIDDGGCAGHLVRPADAGLAARRVHANSQS